jgi:hypothetical protein
VRWDVATEEGVYPIADGWLGRDALKDVHLLPHEG